MAYTTAKRYEELIEKLDAFIVDVKTMKADADSSGTETEQVYLKVCDQQLVNAVFSLRSAREAKKKRM